MADEEGAEAEAEEEEEEVPEEMFLSYLHIQQQGGSW
jgi:hypothetical protein